MKYDKNTVPAWAQLVREIPDYQTATDLRPILDEIIGRYDVYDPESLRDFSDDAQADADRVAEELLATQGEGFDDVGSKLENAQALIGGINIENLGKKVASFTQKGMNVALRNKGMLAATAAASFALGPLALLGGGAAIFAKEKTQSLRDKFKPETLESIDRTLTEGLANYKPAVTTIRDAKDTIPTLRQNVRALGEANMQALIKTTLCIAAGREMVRRIVEEELPKQERAADEDAIEKLRLSQTIIANKLTLREGTRNGSVLDITTAATLSQAVNDLEQGVDSILTNEMAQQRRTLTAMKTTLSVVRTTRVVDEFRRGSQNNIANTIKAIGRTGEIAAANRSDSPEQLQRQLDNINNMKKVLEKTMAALPAAAQQRRQLQAQIPAAITDLVDAQVAYSRTVAANNNQLEAGDSAKALPAAGGKYLSAGPGQ